MPSRPRKKLCHCCNQRRLMTSKTGLQFCADCDEPNFAFVLKNRRVFKGPRLDDALTAELA